MARIAINIATGALQQDEIIVGIDLGTTNSLIAIVHPESQVPVTLRETDGSNIVPSVVHISESGEILIGDTAKQYLESDPGRTIYSIKSLLGKNYSDFENNKHLLYELADGGGSSMVQVRIDNKNYSPVTLSSYILKDLKKRAEHILKTPVNKAVITVPAYFNDAQRQATRDAGNMAGLEVLRIVNEPTAASLAYGIGLNKNRDAVIAVYDLGGGTFDISILKISNGVFEVLSTNGNTDLGGDDFDNAISDHWMEKYFSTQGDENNNFKQELRLKAEAAKITLTDNITYIGELRGTKIQLSLADFEQLIQPWIELTITACRNALKDAGHTIDQIDSVVMVGGSTRTPFVQQAVEAFFKKPLHTELNPDEVVAWGAAIQANILAGKSTDVLLLDVTPLSLGVETAGGLMDVLVPRNSKIPSSSTRQYTTQADGQSGMRISVFQGERDLVKDNRKLAEFNLTGIPAMPAGLAKVEIRFTLNADGILTIAAKELRSGVSQEIEVKPQYGLTDEEVEKMLLDSMSNAKNDVDARALAEAVTEGEQLLKTTERFLDKNAAQLNRQEIMDTASAMQDLQMALSLQDRKIIQEKTEVLNNVSRPYAERVMDEAISKAARAGDFNEIAKS